MGRPANTIDRMMRLNVIVSPSGCWEWTGKIADNGYGHTSINGQSHLAHRAFYTSFKGEIGEGLTIDHLCRNRKCVNPDHLEAVSHRENNLRGPQNPASINHAKTHCVHGHELSGANLHIRRRGSNVSRVCKRCRAEATARYNARKGI